MQRRRESNLFVQITCLLTKHTTYSLHSVQYFSSFHFKIELISMRKTRKPLFIFSNCGYLVNLRHLSDGVVTNLIKLCIPKIY